LSHVFNEKSGLKKTDQLEERLETASPAFSTHTDNCVDNSNIFCENENIFALAGGSRRKID